MFSNITLIFFMSISYGIHYIANTKITLFSAPIEITE